MRIEFPLPQGLETIPWNQLNNFGNLIPGLGRFNWPMSMLTWDVNFVANCLGTEKGCPIVGFSRQMFATRFNGWQIVNQKQT